MVVHVDGLVGEIKHEVVAVVHQFPTGKEVVGLAVLAIVNLESVVMLAFAIRRNDPHVFQFSPDLKDGTALHVLAFFDMPFFVKGADPYHCSLKKRSLSRCREAGKQQADSCKCLFHWVLIYKLVLSDLMPRLSALYDAARVP